MSGTKTRGSRDVLYCEARQTEPNSEMWGTTSWVRWAGRDRKRLMIPLPLTHTQNSGVDTAQTTQAHRHTVHTL